MRTILLAISIVLLPAASLADPSVSQNPDQSAKSGRLIPLKRAGAGNSCAAYGPGFVKVEGSDTCVKIGGAIGVGVGNPGGWR
jgi:hypothetical protein